MKKIFKILIKNSAFRDLIKGILKDFLKHIITNIAPAAPAGSTIKAVEVTNMVTDAAIDSFIDEKVAR
jgi:hypothetical protein